MLTWIQLPLGSSSGRMRVMEVAAFEAPTSITVLSNYLVFILLWH